MRLAATFLAALAIALAGCESLFEPQATVTGGLNSPTIAQAQAVPYNGPRARIAVVSFDQKAAKGYGRVGDGLADMLATELVNTNRFIVLERQELGAVMAEQDLARSGRVSAATGAPTGQIEGAELLVTGAVTAFEPNYQGGSLGGILLSRRHPGGLGAGLKQAYIAIDMRIIDARTSRIVAATTVEGRATDIAGSIGGVIGGGSSRLGIGLGAFRNTPMEKAVRVCLAKAVQFIVSRTPPQYYHYDTTGRPVGAAQPASQIPASSPIVAQQPQPITRPQAPAQQSQPQQPRPKPPAAGQLPDKVFVAFATVRICEKPDVQSKTVANAARGTPLAVQAKHDKWYFVTLPDGKSGWVLKAFTSTTAPK